MRAKFSVLRFDTRFTSKLSIISFKNKKDKVNYLIAVFDKTKRKMMKQVNVPLFGRIRIFFHDPSFDHGGILIEFFSRGK